MKNIFYVWIVAAVLLLPGCDKTKVGYLVTDEAAYPVNRMEIYNLGSRIAGLQQVQADFNREAGPLQAQYETLNAEYKEKEKAYEEYNRYTVQPVVDSVSYILDAVADAGLIAQLKARLEGTLYPERDRLSDLKNKAQIALQAVERKIEDLCAQMGIASVIALKDEIADLERRVKYKIPWSSSTIEGVLGTEPLSYEVVSVKNTAHPEDAARFMPYVGMMGGGRIYVQQEVDAPAGEYVLTIRVFNEGWSDVLEDAFTFVIVD